jgi:hypothetical protein
MIFVKIRAKLGYMLYQKREAAWSGPPSVRQKEHPYLMG